MWPITAIADAWQFAGDSGARRIPALLKPDHDSGSIEDFTADNAKDREAFRRSVHHRHVGAQRSIRLPLERNGARRHRDARHR